MSNKIHSLAIFIVFFGVLVLQQTKAKPDGHYECTVKSCADLKKFQKCLAKPKFIPAEHPNCMQSALNTIRGLSLPNFATKPLVKSQDATSRHSDISAPVPITNAMPDGLVGLLKDKAPWMLPEIRDKNFNKNPRHHPDLNVLPGAPVRIFSVDGGGVKGVIPAAIVADMEHQLGRPITEIFHIFVGTSTGGLIAIFLNTPDAEGRQKYSAAEMLHLYINLAQKVFQKRGVGVFRSTYSPTPLIKLLQEYLGFNRVSDTVKPLVVTSYDLKNKAIFPIATRYGIMSPKMNLFLYEAGRATSAAPTFFPPFKVTLSSSISLELVDGGIMANNPSMVALMEAKEIYPGRSYSILSLGTGDYNDPKAPKGSGAVNMLVPTIEALFKGPMQLTQDAIQVSVGRGNYQRFSPLLTKKQDDMANVKDENIKSLREVVQKQILESHAYKNFIKKLQTELLLEEYLRAINKFIESTKDETYRITLKKMNDRIQSQLHQKGKNLENAYRAKYNFQKRQVLGEARLIPDIKIRKAFIQWIVNGEDGFDWALEKSNLEEEHLDDVTPADLKYIKDHPEDYTKFLVILSNPESVRRSLLLAQMPSTAQAASQSHRADNAPVPPHIPLGNSHTPAPTVQSSARVQPVATTPKPRAVSWSAEEKESIDSAFSYFGAQPLAAS